MDGCGNRRLNPACGVARGREIKLTATCDDNEILQYEWTINTDVFTQTADEIIIDTTPIPEGDIMLGLRVENSCGWSDVIEKTITIIAPIACAEPGCKIMMT